MSPLLVPGTSAALSTQTLYVDNVNGLQTTGCTGPGASACQTIQEGVTAAEALTATAVTLDVAGSNTNYDETVTINIPSGSTDTLDIQGTGTTLPTLDDAGTTSDIFVPSTSIGAITVEGLTISGGHGKHGGGINDLGSGTLSVMHDTLSDNTANLNGGAIDVADGCGFASSGSLVVTGSTFDANTAIGPDGGAIDAQDCSGTGSLTVSDSTFEGNSGPNGGAIGSFAMGTVTNSSFVSNTATSANGGAFTFEGTLNLTDDTFSANADTAIANNFSGTVNVANSILDDSSVGPDCSGTITDGGHNVSSDATCGFGPTSISNSTTIGPLSLAANGSSGPLTAAITNSSSAFNEVPKSACTITTDERGLPRPGIGPNCDAGAFEVQAPQAPPAPPAQPGYDLAGGDGGVFVFPTGQSSGFFGSLPGLGVKVSDIVGIVPTNNFMGYDLVGADGGVFVFPTGQSTGFFGSLPGLGVKVSDIVGIVATPGGGGYFLVGRDGGVFTFGNAPYLGSLPGLGVKVDDITGIVATPSGNGYYLVGSNGAVYAFGDAQFHGSLPGLGVSVSDIVSIVPTPDGNGYWLIGADGGVFAFPDATSMGSLPGLGVRVNDIIGAVPTG